MTWENPLEKASDLREVCPELFENLSEINTRYNITDGNTGWSDGRSPRQTCGILIIYPGSS